MKLHSMSVSRVLRSLRYRLTFASRVQRKWLGVREALYRPMPPSRCVPVDEALRFVGSNAVKLAKTRQPHGHSSTWRRSHVIIQALERCQDVVQTETWHFAKIRMGFDGVHIRRPGLEDHPLLVRRKPGIFQDIGG